MTFAELRNAVLIMVWFRLYNVIDPHRVKTEQWRNYEGHLFLYLLRTWMEEFIFTVDMDGKPSDVIPQEHMITPEQVFRELLFQYKKGSSGSLYHSAESDIHRQAWLHRAEMREQLERPYKHTYVVERIGDSAPLQGDRIIHMGDGLHYSFWTVHFFSLGKKLPKNLTSLGYKSV